MDELVRKILNIENRANRMVEDEKERLSVLSKDVEAIADEKKKAAENKSLQRIDRISESEAEDEKARLEAIESEYEKNIEKLETTLGKNREKWINEIFERITS